MFKKKICCLLLALMFVMNSSIISNAKTYTLVYDYNREITQSTQYISPTFIPQTDSIGVIYNFASSYRPYYSRYYLEKYTDGTWCIADSDTIDGGGIISTGYWVTPNVRYRIRAISNDPFKRYVCCAVTEERD